MRSSSLINDQSHSSAWAEVILEAQVKSLSVRDQLDRASTSIR